ncbi:unnamed protein product [Prunus armeniaca]
METNPFGTTFLKINQRKTINYRGGGRWVMYQGGSGLGGVMLSDWILNLGSKYNDGFGTQPQTWVYNKRKLLLVSHAQPLLHGLSLEVIELALIWLKQC